MECEVWNMYESRYSTLLYDFEKLPENVKKIVKRLPAGPGSESLCQPVPELGVRDTPSQ